MVSKSDHANLLVRLCLIADQVELESDEIWDPRLLLMTGVVILSFASKSDDANSSSYGAGITSIGGR